jgi:hypothetical protein
MHTVDLKKELKELYNPSAREVGDLEVPEMTFLTIDGEGDPNSSEVYQGSVEALFSVAYAVKFLVKKGPSRIDYGVMPLEGLWWADDMSRFSVDNKSEWKWTMMIMQPAFVTQELIGQALDGVRKKKKLKGLDDLRICAYAEGRSAQILHVGPFADEGPTIERLHRYIASRGVLTGKHHEIYLSDIRKADPAKWRTIIRQPYRLHD